MSLAMKVISTPTTGPCGRCKDEQPAVRITLFLGALAGDSEVVCLRCLGTAERMFDVSMVDLTPAPTPKRQVMRQQKKLSQKQELDIAADLGAKVQVGSGAFAGSKGDVRKKGVCRVEAKYTEARSYRLELDELYKIQSECHGRERAVFVIDFRDRQTGQLCDRFAVVPWQMAKEMLNETGEHQ